MTNSPEVNDSTTPPRHLSVIDAVAIVVGIVIGAAIFSKLAVYAAANVNSGSMLLLAYVVAGLICLCGALTYAELASAYPKASGEYAYLAHAYGRPMGFFFAWARLTVIQTGSIAFLAMIFGGAASGLLYEVAPGLAEHGAITTLIFAAAAVVILTFVNAAGLKTEKWTQNLLTAVKVLGVLAIITAGIFFFTPDAPAAAPAAGEAITTAAASAAPESADPFVLAKFVTAIVLILFIFGGWNEAAYVAGEVRNPKRNMLRVLLISVVALTVLYLGMNLCYLRVLGRGGMLGTLGPGAPRLVAAETMYQVFGKPGSIAVSFLVAISALGAITGCIFTGARSASGLGNDYRVFRALARVHPRHKTPVNAVLVLGAISLIIVLIAGIGDIVKAKFSQGAEQVIVFYTAPVFWTFMVLIGLSLLVLRRRDPKTERPFRVPLYPLVPILFIVACGYLVYNQITYHKEGSLVGVAVLAAGVPLYFLFCRSPQNASGDAELAEGGQPSPEDKES